MSTTKNTISIFCIIFLLSSPCQSFFNLCENKDLIACIAQLEAEIINCYEIFHADDIYNWGANDTENKITAVPDPDFFSVHKRREFPLIYTSFKKIAQFAGDIQPGHNGGITIHTKMNEIFLLSNYSHHFAKKAVRKANPYHNVCRGLANMVMSGIIYHEFHSRAVNIHGDITQAFIMFAGLFSNVLHPGIGNKVFGAKNNLKNALYADVKAAIEAYTDDVNETTFSQNVRNALNDAIEIIEDEKDGNAGGTFNWEMVQAQYALGAAKGLFGEICDACQTAILENIQMTYSGSQDRWAMPLYWKMFNIHNLNNEDLTEDAFETEMGELENGEYFPNSSIMRLADLAPFAAVTKEYLLLSLKSLKMEELNEVVVIKGTDIQNVNQLDEYTRVCGQNTYANIYQSMDDDLNNDFSDIVEKKILPTNQNRAEFKAASAIFRGEYANVIEFAASSNAVDDMINQVGQDFDNAYDNAAKAPNTFPILKHFLDGFGINRTFLNLNIFIPPNDNGTMNVNYFYVHSNDYDAACDLER